ncbi:hypothetical protein KRP22_007530 [Phytophthora ramorum]|nr:UTP:RNA uridylyltransferase 1 [Phytophthora ramorum]
MKRQDRDADAAAPSRKKRRGRRKSKAERLARVPPVASSPEDLDQLLRGSSSREWDAAQSLALRLDTAEARATVVRVILRDREAPRAAAHYAKRLGLNGDDLLAAVNAADVALSPLLLAQFLVELDERTLATSERLRRFVWPWLADKKGQEQVVKAAVHLMLHPTASDDAKVQDKKERGLGLQRALVTQCLKTGELLHLVPTHARAFAGRMTAGSAVDEEGADDDADMELQPRQQVARRVQNVLRLLWPDARVLLFGSSVTGLLSSFDDVGRSSADVDLCALLPSAPQFRQETAPLVTEVREHLMLYLLPDATGENEQDATAVTRARIPIVHFRDPASDLPCDLCVNNVPAIWNTRLLRWFLYGGTNANTLEKKQRWQVRRLCRWLREWRQAKKRVVGGALSSYGLMLLGLYYLQRINVLPVLDCSAHVVEDGAALRVLKEGDIDEKLEKADKSFVGANEQANREVQGWRSLRRGFFRFYACEFDYEHTVVSLRAKDIMPKASKGWSRQNDSRLCLEDPVETERDLGALCSRRAFGRLRCAFAHACVILSSKEEDRDNNSPSVDVETDLLAPWAYENAQEEEEKVQDAAEDNHGTVN